MRSFKTIIKDPKPIVFYIYNATVNLQSGKVTSKEITEGKEQFFERIPDTGKSRILFKGAEIKNGFVNVYFIVLENKKAYFYLKGNTPETAIKRGDFFMDIKDLNTINKGFIETYLQSSIKEWSKLYVASEWTKLEDAVNSAFDALQKQCWRINKADA